MAQTQSLDKFDKNYQCYYYYKKENSKLKLQSSDGGSNLLLDTYYLFLMTQLYSQFDGLIIIITVEKSRNSNLLSDDGQKLLGVFVQHLAKFLATLSFIVLMWAQC